MQIIQIDRDLSSEVAKETREIDGKIGEFVERKVTAEDQLKRVDIRAPQDGMVFQSNVHTVGGVITAGDAIMLIVPDADNLTVEAKVNPQDIDQVRPGQTALLRLSAFNQRTTPEIYGTVTRISADASTDQRTGADLLHHPDRACRPRRSPSSARSRLVPGMPVEAFVQTGDRTMISYLVKPLQRSADADVPGEVTGKIAPVQGAFGWFDMKWLSRLARRFTSARALCVVLLFALLFLRVTDPAPLEELRLRAFDLFQVIKPRVATQRPVVIVDIDEESLRKLGQWPWPRTRVADLITRLTKLGAAAIAFDVIFAEPDRLSPALAADVFRDLDEETRNKLRALPSNDQVMADAIKQSRVVLGETGLPIVVPQPDTPAGRGRRRGAGRRSEALPVHVSRACCGIFRSSKRPPPGAACSAFAPSATASCGACRWSCRRRAPSCPSLTFEMLRVATGASTILIRMDEAGIKSVAVPGLRNADRPQRPALGPFRAARPGALRVRRRRARRTRHRRPRVAAGSS